MKQSTFLVLIATGLLIACSLATIAQTTTALVLNTTQLDEKARSSSSKVYLDGQKMKTEVSGEKEGQEVLFDGETETIYIIDHRKKEYMEMTREDMEALSAMLKEQMALMEQQLEMLPAEQRETIRKKMNTAMGGTATATEYAVEAENIPVKDWNTRKYVGTADGSKQSEIYIASYKELDLDAEDFEAMTQFFELMKNYAQNMSKGFSGSGIAFFSENMPGYTEGVPVKTIFFDAAGNAVSTHTIESIGEEEVEEAIFDIPEGYKQKKMKGLPKSEN